MIHIHEEAARCLLCENAPCTKACKKGDPARAIQAIRFDNEKNALRWLKDCSEADLLAAEKACIHYDQPLRIRELFKAVEELGFEEPDTLPDLGITFCGIPCENPFFLASSAVSTNYDMIARAFKAGWAGVFYKTICKMDIQEVSPRFDAVGKKLTSFIGFRNMEQLSEHVYTEDLEIMRRLKKDFPTKVVIASIMGKYEEEWIELAKLAEEAGCDAVELNFSCPQMRLAGTGSDVGQDTELVACYTTYVKQNVHIPVIPKMTPNITNINHPAMGAYFAGADAVSAINTIKSITMSRKAMVNGKKTISGYSGRAVKPIALRFIHDMAKNKIMKGLELSGIGGIETWTDALDFIMLGCRNVQVCTAVMQYGNRIIDDLKLGLQTFMKEHGYNKVEELVGLELPNFVPPSELDRETMVYPKIDRDVCIGCGRCYVSCQDGGHQAITFGDDRLACLRGLPSDRKAFLPHTSACFAA